MGSTGSLADARYRSARIAGMALPKKTLLEEGTGAFVIHFVEKTGSLVEKGRRIIRIEPLILGEVGSLGLAFTNHTGRI